MNDVLHVAIGLACVVALLLFFSGFLVEAWRRPKATPAPAPDASPSSPYRTAQSTSAPAQPTKETKPPLPVVIIDWNPRKNKAGRFVAVCPACETAWQWNTVVSPALCACAECLGPHFHFAVEEKPS